MLNASPSATKHLPELDFPKEFQGTLARIEAAAQDEQVEFGGTDSSVYRLYVNADADPMCGEALALDEAKRLTDFARGRHTKAWVVGLKKAGQQDSAGRSYVLFVASGPAPT